MRVLTWVLVSFAALLVLAFVALQFLFDPNDYKPLVIEQVKQHTGRELVLNGDISWRFFPTLSLGVESVQLRNPENFEEQPMLSVKSATVSVQVWPLLSGNIQLGELVFEGLRLNLLTLEDGRNNLDDLVQKEKDTGSESEGTKPKSIESPSPIALELAGLRIVDAEVSVKDLQAETEQQLILEYVTLSQFVIGQPTPLTFKLVAGQGKQLLMDLEGSAELEIDPSMQLFSVTDMILEAEINGDVVPQQPLSIETHGRVKYYSSSSRVTLNLSTLKVGDIDGTLNVDARFAPKLDAEFVAKFDKIDLDSWLPGETSAEKTKSDEGVKSPAPTAQDKPSEELDLGILHQVSVVGDVEVGSLIASGVSMQKVQAHVEVGDGRAAIDPFQANLYSGHLASAASLTDSSNKPVSQLEMQLSGVDINPLLKSLADTDILAGTADFQLSVKSRGMTPDDLKKSAKGKGKFIFKDGSFKGINVAHTIRKGYATLKGNSDDIPDEPEKTDFTSLTGSFTLKNGLVNNPDLDVRSPLLRINGSGKANILSESIDYGLTTAFVGSLKGQQGESAEELSALRIPLRITGTFTKPKYNLDEEKILQGEAKEKLDEAKEKVDEEKDKLLEKAKGKLDKLFGDL